MKTLLIPVFDNRISSRLDCAEYFQLVKIDGNKVNSTEKIRVLVKNHLEKINFILSIKPDTIICNGLTEFFENEFEKNSIKVIPWVHGQYEDVIQNFIKGKLASKVRQL